jgi:SAM-dependent methyltransferase
MAEQQIRFDDGAAYERMMGVWSRMAGEIFLSWLAPRSGGRWIDIGCGNGAFTELIVEKCAPAEVQGIDPSDGQLAFARTRPAARIAKFQQGDAMALPFPDNSFDAATMALVIFFVPDPAKGVAEMARVVAPGGTVAAYAWDMEGGGFPLEPVLAEIRALGRTHMNPPRNDASRIESMQALWTGAGLEGVETREIKVQRTFADFEDYWTTGMLGAIVSTTVNAMPADEVALLKKNVRARLPSDATGRVTYEARANAVKGVVRR